MRRHLSDVHRKCDGTAEKPPSEVNLSKERTPTAKENIDFGCGTRGGCYLQINQVRSVSNRRRYGSFRRFCFKEETSFSGRIRASCKSFVSNEMKFYGSSWTAVSILKPSKRELDVKK